MKKEKVLLIDDDTNTRELLKRVIDKEGFETILASDGAEGMKVFKSENPGIIITDINMPNIDGLEVLYMVKQISPSTEVILITAFGDYDTVILALQQGVLDYLKKPIDLNQLLLSLGRAMDNIIKRKKISIKSNLLILEDNIDTKNRLARIFKKEGYKIYTGADGEEGIKIFSQNKIDIVITDIKMSKKDGIEVLHEIKKISNDCEVIMLTGYGEEATAIEAMRAGAINYIRKPVDIERLLLFVQKAENKQQLQRSYLYKTRELELAKEIIVKVTGEKELIVELQDHIIIKVENFASNIINAVPLILVLTDKDMNVDFVNNNFNRLYGYFPKQIDEKFIEKLSLKHIGIERIKQGVRDVCDMEKLEVIPTYEQNMIFMRKVFLVKDKEKTERVLIIISGCK